jgi:hypothetical protein
MSNIIFEGFELLQNYNAPSDDLNSCQFLRRRCCYEWYTESLAVPGLACPDGFLGYDINSQGAIFNIETTGNKVLIADVTLRWMVFYTTGSFFKIGGTGSFEMKNFYALRSLFVQGIII